MKMFELFILFMLFIWFMLVAGEVRQVFLFKILKLQDFKHCKVDDLTKNSYFYRKLLVMSEIRSRITINPEVCHGKPCIRGMRWPVEVIIDMLGSGMTTDEILNDHPELEKEDILASLKFAKLFLTGHSIKDVA